MGENVARRHFLAVATGTYDDRSWAPMPEVYGQVATIREWLCAPELGNRRFIPVWSELADDPTEDQIRARLRNLARDRAWSEDDAVVLVVAGHGVEEDGSHYLVLRDSDSRMVASTALRTSDLISWLADSPVQELLVIMDSDFAQDMTFDAFRFNRELGRHWLMLPTVTTDHGHASGELLSAMGRFIKQLRTPEGRRYGEGPYIDASHFVQDLQALLGEGEVVTPLYGGQLDGPHVCLPNPHYRGIEGVITSAARHSLALALSDLNTHWGPRSRGVASDDEAGWLFTGRASLMRALIAAATGRPRATVVTGGAGSGKSAALARLVTLSDEDFVKTHAAEVVAIPDELRPPVGAVDAAVLATGKLPGQILTQICQFLAVPPPTSSQAEPTIDQRLVAWHAWLVAQPKPITLVIDGLDEATDPQALVRDVLSRLEPEPGQPRMRLLVGVRSLAAADDVGTGMARPADGTSLVDAAESTLRASRLAVDEAPWWDQNDVVLYVESILRNTPRSLYPSAGPDVMKAVAAAVGERAGRSFLVARIAASSLADRDSVISLDDPAWLAALDSGVLGVFRDDLHHSIGDEEDRRRAVVLLRAVAYAKGAGLPWRGVWPLVAYAVDDEGRHYGDTDISWLLRSRLGGYLITDREEDTTVYRLFHDMLRSTLRDRWRELLAPS